MSFFESIRQGYSPEWKAIWYALLRLGAAIGALIAVIATFVAYSRGDMQHAIFYAIIVLWTDSAEAWAERRAERL